MQQQDTVVTTFPALGSLVLIVGIVLLIYLATKGCKKFLLCFLGAGVLFFLISLIFYVDVGMVIDDSKDVASTQPKVVTIDKEPPIASESTLSNKELWERLTKPRIKLDAVEEDKAANIESQSEAPEKQEADDATEVPTEEAKPAWVENPPKRMGNVYRRVVSSELYSTVDECHFHLEDQLCDAVRERVQTLIADGSSDSIVVGAPASFGIGLDYIMREICQDEFTETVPSSVGDMKRVHVLMEFSPSVERHLRTAWEKHERYYRLGVVGKFAAMALSLLAGTYGLLKFDTWTRGYYSKQLLLGVPAAIIAIVLLLIL